MIKILIISALLTGCSGQTARYILIDGNVTRQSPELSDWQFTAGGKPRNLIGSVSVTAGLERDGYSVYGGINHYSLADFGHDAGFSGLVIGISKRITF